MSNWPSMEYQRFRVLQLRSSEPNLVSIIENYSICHHCWSKCYRWHWQYLLEFVFTTCHHMLVFKVSSVMQRWFSHSDAEPTYWLPGCTIRGMTQLVLPTFPGNPAAVQVVQSRLLPGKQGYPLGSGTCLDGTAVPSYGSDNICSKLVFEFWSYHDMVKM